jgi:hypothetical protein
LIISGVHHRERYHHFRMLDLQTAQLQHHEEQEEAIRTCGVQEVLPLV